MSNYLKKFIVQPAAKVRLKHFDPDYHGKHESHEEALPEIQKHIEQINELQYVMYAEKKHSLLVVLQGLDAAMAWSGTFSRE
jgi:polyphosphate kinase 2 (PPK2 family)